MGAHGQKHSVCTERSRLDEAGADAGVNPTNNVSTGSPDDHDSNGAPERPAKACLPLCEHGHATCALKPPLAWDTDGSVPATIAIDP